MKIPWLPLAVAALVYFIFYSPVAAVSTFIGALLLGAAIVTAAENGKKATR